MKTQINKTTAVKGTFWAYPHKGTGITQRLNVGDEIFLETIEQRVDYDGLSQFACVFVFNGERHYSSFISLKHLANYIEMLEKRLYEQAIGVNLR